MPDQSILQASFALREPFPLYPFFPSVFFFFLNTTRFVWTPGSALLIRSPAVHLPLLLNAKRTTPSFLWAHIMTQGKQTASELRHFQDEWVDKALAGGEVRASESVRPDRFDGLIESPIYRQIDKATLIQTWGFPLHFGSCYV